VPSPPVYSPLVIRQGMTERFRWPVTDPVTGDPVNISSWSARGQVRKWPGAAEVLHEWSTTAGNLTLGVDGLLTITVSPSESSSWDWSEGRYDIELTMPNDDVIRIAEGAVMVSAEITR
jgi:hypothetical protein